MKSEKEFSTAVYDFVESLGSAFIYYFKKIFNKLLLTPLLILLGYLKKFRNFVIKNFVKINSDIRKERKNFNNDLKYAHRVYKSNKKADILEKESSVTLLYRFYMSAVNNHKSFLKYVFSVSLPIISVIILLIVVKYNTNLDFALKVKYNGADIGYIDNEQVFRDAEEIIKERLAFGGQEYSSDVVSHPQYEVSVVHPNELTDSNEICEKIIENSDSGLITACGVYIDEKFICSVKNESDASYVFKNFISEYCKKNDIDLNDSKYMVDIVEDITYIQGLYSEKTLMSSEEIDEYIKNQNKSESIVYTSKYGDTVDSIIKNYNLTEEQFYALNPSVKDDNGIPSGKKLNVIRSIPYINIAVSETRTQTKEIKFKTVEINTDSLFQGARKIVTEGRDGVKKITNLVTYVNGVKVSEKEIKSKVITKPVDEKIYVGTKPAPFYVDLYGVETGTFIWPAVGVDYVTSGFGYRMLYNELNFHRGLDISGAGALGKPIIASAAGTVELVTAGNTGYGYSVLIDHGNGIKTRYGHCLADSIVVNIGDHVEQGQMIAQVGSTGNSTGPHLHFEIIYNGAYTNPLDYLTR